MNRFLKIFINIGLALGLLVTLVYYFLLGWGAVEGVGIIGGVTLFPPGDLGRLMTVHDFLTLLLICYWFHLVINFRRMDRPLVPFALFVYHVALEPYLLLGARGASFIQTGRFMLFYLAYPLALAMLTLWLVSWLLRSRPLNGITVVDSD